VPQLDLFAPDQVNRPARVKMPPGVRAGTSGWLYKDWVGPFYLAGLSQPEWLTAYAEVFDTVEIDSTFYATPPLKTVKGWRDRTPPGFTFAAKLPREITHDRMLVAAAGPLAEFLGAIETLGDRLGPLLIQMPPAFRKTEANRATLERFLAELPTGLRFALELRDRRWFSPDLFSLLEERKIALALCDWPGVPVNEVATAPFTYVRLIGDREAVKVFSHVVVDRTGELDRWAKLIQGFVRVGRDIWAFANNHYAGHGPQTIRELVARL
jgi:uncharacterized protein YecE (DUF72 family)